MLHLLNIFTLEYRLSGIGTTQKLPKNNRLEPSLKRRGRRKGSKLDEKSTTTTNSAAIVGLKKRQINESEKVKRGQQRDSPLSDLERELAHPDQHLAPTEKSPHDLVSFSSELIAELQKQVRSIKFHSSIIIQKLNTTVFVVL